MGSRLENTTYFAQTCGVLFAFTLIITCVYSCKKSGKGLDEIEKETFGVIESAELFVAGIPLGESSVVELDISVKDANGLGYYYKLAPSSFTDCGEQTDYTFKPPGSPIKENISSFPDGGITLCVAPKEGDSIALTKAVQSRWVKYTPKAQAVQGLGLKAKDEAMELSWSGGGGGDSQSFLVIQSKTPLSWKPKDKESYTLGQVFQDTTIAYIGGDTSTVISGLENNEAYYFAVYAYDDNRQYQKLAEEAGIVSKDKYAWIKRRDGTLYEMAYAAGHLKNPDDLTYLCRAPTNEAPIQFYFGQLFPSNGDLNAGVCWMSNQNTEENYIEKDNYEVLAIAAGYKADKVFVWTPNNENLFLAGIYDGFDAEGKLQKDLKGYFCRFEEPSTNELAPTVFTKEFGLCNPYSLEKNLLLNPPSDARIEYLTNP